MNKFCESLREHSMKITNFKNEKLNLLTSKHWETEENAKTCYICIEMFESKYMKDKKYRKVRDYCHYTGDHRGAVDTKCNLTYTVPKKIPIAFHNGSKNDYHFIIID